MQATCEKCGKTITREDFSDGRYFLFWITPTVPSESMYLCDDCRGIPWDEREALFDAWWEQRQARPTPKRKAKKLRKTSGRCKTRAKPKASEPASIWEDPAYRSRELPKLAQKAFELSR